MWPWVMGILTSSEDGTSPRLGWAPQECPPSRGVADLCHPSVGGGRSRNQETDKPGEDRTPRKGESERRWGRG